MHSIGLASVGFLIRPGCNSSKGEDERLTCSYRDEAVAYNQYRDFLPRMTSPASIELKPVRDERNVI